MDEDFEIFLKKGFAPAIDCRTVDEATLNRYRGRLPDKLLEYWQSFGWCGYGEGRFWTVDPAEYEEILELWLGQTPIWGRENFYVIARDAFGTLYVWGDRGEGKTTIMPPLQPDHSKQHSQRAEDKREKEPQAGYFFQFEQQRIQ